MKTHMIMDNSTGVIFFTVKYDSTGFTKVLRVDPTKEMGSADFIKALFSFRCEYVHFIRYVNDKLYLMDNKKRIRVLEWENERNRDQGLTQKYWLDQNEDDRTIMWYVDFDDYVVSTTGRMLHWGSRAIHLHKNLKMNKNDETWEMERLMASGYGLVSGPKQVTGTGMIWYLEECSWGVDDETQSKFSVVMQPLTDESFIDFLP